MIKILIACQNTNFGGIKTLFDISLRLIAENSLEILIFISDDVWLLSVDENDLVPRSNDPVGESDGTCLFWISLVRDRSGANGKWKDQISESQRPNVYAELWRTKWVRIEYFPKIHIDGYSHTNPASSENRQMNPKQFEGIFLFMSMFNDIDWTMNGNSIAQYFEFQMSERLRNKDFSEHIGHSSVPEMRKNGMGHMLTNQ